MWFAFHGQVMHHSAGIDAAAMVPFCLSCLATSAVGWRASAVPQVVSRVADPAASISPQSGGLSTLGSRVASEIGSFSQPSASTHALCALHPYLCVFVSLVTCRCWQWLYSQVPPSRVREVRVPCRVESCLVRSPSLHCSPHSALLLPLVPRQAPLLSTRAHSQPLRLLSSLQTLLPSVSLQIGP